MKFAEQLAQLRRRIEYQHRKTAQFCGNYLWPTEISRQKLRGKSRQGITEQIFRYHLGTQDMLERVANILDAVLSEPSIHKMKHCLRNELRDLRVDIDRSRDRADHPERYRHETNELGIWQSAAAARVGQHYYVLLYRLSLPIEQQRVPAGMQVTAGTASSPKLDAQSYSDGVGENQVGRIRRIEIEVIRETIPSAEFVVGDRIVRFYRDNQISLNDYRIETYRDEEKLSDYDYQVSGFPITQKTAEWWVRRSNGEDLWGYRDWTCGESYHLQCTPEGWLDTHQHNQHFREIRRNTPSVGGMFCSYCRGPIDYIPRM